MEQSILKSTKKLLGLGVDDESFDLDILTHINSAFSTLNDLGVGPVAGFVIEDDTVEWESYFDGAPEDPNDPDHLIQLGKIKMVIYLRTRVVFDPPTTSFVLEALNKQIQEAEWRLNVNRESSMWVDPNPPVVVDSES